MALDDIMDRPGRLVDAIHAQLHSAVVSGELSPGEQLSVPELARRLQVSRGSVREAVLQLVAEGVAEERPRRGVVVSTVGAEQVRQIHEIREVLEGLTARLCALDPSAKLLDGLEAALARQREAIAADDGAGYADTDADFHALLAAACGNEMLDRMVGRLHVQMQIALDKVAEAAEHRRHGQEELQVVLDAIRARDADAAEAGMRAHIRRTRGEVAAAGGDSQ